MQTEHTVDRTEVFSADYAYFSSFSATWLEHAERYAHYVVERFDLGPGSRVIEVASNDGYLLQHFKALGIPCLGIEPTTGTAAAARRKGIEVIEAFFDSALSARLRAAGGTADLVVANNVLAHVADVNDFVVGLTAILKPEGIATFEFPHLMSLVQGNEFDTIYHEHVFYLSLTAASRVLEHNGLTVFDVEQLPTHGGSLRLYAERKVGKRRRSERAQALAAAEIDAGIETRDFYAGFQSLAERVKNDFLRFLIDANRQGSTVAAYGAAAKGSTLLNYAGVRADLVKFVADRNSAKQGNYMPGSRIPIVAECRIREARPEYVVIFPWNLRDEVMAQLDYIRSWGGRFVTAVPRLEIA